MDEKICVNVSEAAKMLGVSRKFFYQHLVTKEGFPLVQIGRRNLILVEDLKKWMQEQRTK